MLVQVSTRVDKATKQQFDKVCEDIGISPSNALSMFIKSVINYNGIPFNVVASPKIRMARKWRPGEEFSCNPPNNQPQTHP